MDFSRTDECMAPQMSTMDANTVSSIVSAWSDMRVRATALSAEGGQGENQSVVVLLMRDGNWRMRSVYSLPSGLMHITTCKFFFTRLINCA